MTDQTTNKRKKRLQEALERIEAMYSLNSEEYMRGYAEIGNIASEALCPTKQ